MQPIPPLPADWPFAPRPPLPGLQTWDGVALPGQVGPWRLLAREPAPHVDPASLPEAYGRGGVMAVGDWVLRPYRRGGLLRHVNDRTYASSHRFAEEYAVHEALWNAGFPTVEPLGYALRRRGVGWEGCYITRRAEGTPWPRDWERGHRALPAITGLLAALVSWGVWAPDLNATNFLLGDDGQALALDWDRARWVRTRSGLGARYAERLRRSFLRLGAPSFEQEAFERIIPPPWRHRP